MEPLIRRAKIDDVGDLHRLWSELGKDQLKKDPYYKGSFSIGGSCDFENQLRLKECYVLVAEADGRVVGFAEARLRNRDFKFYIEDYVYLMHVFVEPRYRGYNLHNRFVKEIEEWASENNCNYLVADVLRKNEKVIDLLKNYGFDDYRIRLIMRIRGALPGDGTAGGGDT